MIHRTGVTVGQNWIDHNTGQTWLVRCLYLMPSLPCEVEAGLENSSGNSTICYSSNGYFPNNFDIMPTPSSTATVLSSTVKAAIQAFNQNKNIPFSSNNLPIDVDMGMPNTSYMKIGDWTCPAPGCKATLKGDEKSCWRCGTKKP